MALPQWVVQSPLKRAMVRSLLQAVLSLSQAVCPLAVLHRAVVCLSPEAKVPYQHLLVAQFPSLVARLRLAQVAC
jgi:hypothetical protein